jgi:hypothetical protein
MGFHMYSVVMDGNKEILFIPTLQSISALFMVQVQWLIEFVFPHIMLSFVLTLPFD